MNSPNTRERRLSAQFASSPGRLRVLASHLDAPVVSQTSVVSHLLQPLDVVSQLGIQLVGSQLRVFTILNVLLSVQKPIRHAKLSRVGDDDHQRFEFSGGEFPGSFTHIDFRLLADDVRKSAPDTFDFRERVHDLFVCEREKRRKARQRLCFQKDKDKEMGTRCLDPCLRENGRKKKKVALRRARIRERNARSNGPHSR